MLQKKAEETASVMSLSMLEKMETSVKMEGLLDFSVEIHREQVGTDNSRGSYVGWKYTEVLL